MGRNFGAILEDIDNKFDLLLEIVTTLAPLPAQVAAIDERLIRVEADVITIKKVVTDHSVELKDHERRITHLKGVQ